MQTFVNGVTQNRLHPDTFEIPSNEEKADIQPGDHIKVGFLIDEGNIEAERMWLRVTGRNGNSITGTLANDPVCITAYGFGDEFTVTLDEVLSIYKE